MKKIKGIFGRKPKPASAELLQPGHKNPSLSDTSRPASIQSSTLLVPGHNESYTSDTSRPVSLQLSSQPGSPQVAVESSSVDTLPLASLSLQSTSVAEEKAHVSISEPMTSSYQSSQPDEIGPSKDQNTRTIRETLWRRAYALLAEKQPDLVKDYGKHLQGDIDSVNDTNLSVLADPERIKASIANLLEAREKRQWSIKLGGKTVKIKDQVDALAKLLVWSDKIIKDALSAQPYAALAWAGVSVFLPLIEAGSKQNTAMIEGFSAISNCQLYWMNCEDLYLTSSQIDSYTALIEPLAGLYCDILEFQALAICHLSEGQLTRAWQKATGTQDWAGKSKTISLKSEACKAFISNGQQQELRKQTESQLKVLQGISDSTKEIAGLLEHQWQQDQESKLLHLLASMTPNRVDCKKMNPKRAEGTCEWFFTDPTFRRWRDEDTSGLFWLSAGPGCGKSVLSTALIDEDHLETATATLEIGAEGRGSASLVTSTICYFYFKDDDNRRVDGTNALCSLLHQIFTDPNTKSLVEHGTLFHKEHGNGITNSLSQLWDLLLLCSQESSGPIICLLDALDECKEDSRQDLIALLDLFYQSGDHGSQSKLKFFITSRPYGDLEESFECFSEYAAYFRFDGDEKSDDISHDINLVIDQRVQQLGKRRKFTADALKRISDRFKSMGTRTYLWLYLTMSIIEKNVSRYSRAAAVEEILSEIQPNLSEVYEKILAATKSPDITEQLLQILLAATRPLTLQEANHALTLALERQRPASLDELRSKVWQADFAQVVKDLGGLLVQVHDSVISFIHLTAREFLLQRAKDDTASDPHHWQGRFNNTPVLNSTIARVCIDQLLIPDIPIRHEASDVDPSYPFVLYAASNWLHHYRLCQSNTKQHISVDDVLTLLDPVGYPMKVWEPLHFGNINGSLYQINQQPYSEIAPPKAWNGWSSLDIASYYGLYTVIEPILKQSKANIDDPKVYFGTPLQIASASGYKEVVQTLLEYGASVYPDYKHSEHIPRHVDPYRDVSSTSALHAACEQNQIDIVRLLLSRNIDVDLVTSQGTALQVACSLGHDKLVTLLLSNGANPNCETSIKSCLRLASSKGYGSIVRELLCAGADPNHMKPAKRDSKSPLYEACEAGHEAIARQLLLAGADSEAIRCFLWPTQSSYMRLSYDHDGDDTDKEAENHEDDDHGNSSDGGISYSDWSDLDDRNVHYYWTYPGRPTQQVFLRTDYPWLSPAVIVDLVWQICREKLPNSPTTVEWAIAAAESDNLRFLTFLHSKYGSSLNIKRSNLRSAIATCHATLVKQLLESFPVLKNIGNNTLKFAIRRSTYDVIKLLLTLSTPINVDCKCLLKEALLNENGAAEIMQLLIERYAFDDETILASIEILTSDSADRRHEVYESTRNDDLCLQLLVRSLSKEANIDSLSLENALLFATFSTIQFMLQHPPSEIDTETLLCKAVCNHRQKEGDIVRLIMHHFDAEITTAVISDAVKFGSISTVHFVLQNLKNRNYISSELLLGLLPSGAHLPTTRLKAILSHNNPITADVIAQATYCYRLDTLKLLLSRKPQGLTLTSRMVTRCISSNDCQAMTLICESFPSTLQMAAKLLPTVLGKFGIGRRMLTYILQSQRDRLVLSRELLDAALVFQSSEILEILLENTAPLPLAEMTEDAVVSLIKAGNTKALASLFHYSENEVPITKYIITEGLSGCRDMHAVLTELFERRQSCMQFSEDILEAVLFKSSDACKIIPLIASHSNGALAMTQQTLRKAVITGLYNELKILASFMQVLASDLDLAYFVSCIGHNSEEAIRLLRHGFDAEEMYGVSLLWIVAGFNSMSTRIVRILLDRKGANANFCNSEDGSSILFHHLDAAVFGSTRVVDLLLDAGADPNQPNHAGQVPLHVARSITTIENLVRAGADVNISDSNHVTPLHSIATLNPADAASAIEILLKAGARINDANHDGQTALHIALQTEELEYSRHRVLPLRNRSSRRSSRSSSSLSGDSSTNAISDKECRQSTSDQREVADLRIQKTPLDTADEGMDNQQSCSHGEGDPPSSSYKHQGFMTLDTLEYLSEVSEFEEIDYSSTGSGRYHHRTAVEVLVKAGANNDAQDKMLRSPLHYAANGSSTKILKLLLRHGANPLLVDKDGRTALHLVALKGNVTRARLLVNAGADANLRDKDGKTALDLARAARFRITVAYLETVTHC